MKACHKRTVVLLLFLLFTCSLFGCSEKETSIVQSYEKTDTALYDEYFDEGKQFNYVTFYELKNGKWKTDHYTYTYKLEISGQLPASPYKVKYVYLSEEPEISFERAWKASGFSSSRADYFEEKEAVLVAIIRIKE